MGEIQSTNAETAADYARSAGEDAIREVRNLSSTINGISASFDRIAELEHFVKQLHARVLSLEANNPKLGK